MPKNIMPRVLMLFVFLALISFCFSARSLAESPFQKEGLVVKQQNAALFDKFLQFQKAGNSALNKSIRLLRTDFSFSKYLWLLVLSVGFGVLHSAGPGHGKALVAAYFLKSKNTDLNVSKLSLIISFVHTGSAVLLAVLLSTLLLSLKGIARIKMQGYFSLLSGLLIFFIGIWFLILKLRGKGIGDIREDVDINRQLWVVGVSAGIIPCPLALMIMLIAISANIVWLGITSVLGISFGMYLLLLLVGELSLRSRAGLVHIFKKDDKKANWISEGLSYFSIALIIILGGGLAVFFFPW